MLGAKRYKLKYVAESKAQELRQKGWSNSFVMDVYDNTATTKRKIRYLVVVKEVNGSIKYVLNSEEIGEF